MRKLGLGKKGMESQIQEEAQQLVEFFADTKGQPFDPLLPITKSVANVICATTFGHQFSIEDKDFLDLMEAVSVVSKFGGTIFYLLYEGFPYIMKHLPGPHQAALSAVEMMILFVKKQIKQHMENQNLHEPEDFIDFYLFQMEKSKDDPNSTYDEDNLAQCIVDFFVGGTETTLTYLQWALLLMATHLDIQDKVYKEMEKVLGSSHSVCYEDWRKLPYTNAVIHEIMRNKYSLLFGLPRQCVQDIYLNGFLIPKGAVIFPDLRSVLSDPEHWETPEEFNPNNFLDKEGNFVLKEAFLPFGADTSTAERPFGFGPAASLFLELLGIALRSSPVAYWTPSDLRGSSSSVISFSLFTLSMGFSWQGYWSGLPFPSPADHILSELCHDLSVLGGPARYSSWLH
ncbi:cytochrome P450 2J5-like [Liasis olivaceus]